MSIGLLGIIDRSSCGSHRIPLKYGRGLNSYQSYTRCCVFSHASAESYLNMMLGTPYSMKTYLNMMLVIICLGP